MLYSGIITLFFGVVAAHPSPAPQHPSSSSSLRFTTPPTTSNITTHLFASLEELSRLVDISYCVGTTGISHPFVCASRCADFPTFELVDTFNTGPLMSDSCGYIALDHRRNTGEEKKGRILLAFRGTYSIANTIVDLSTVPQEYVPYPDQPGNGSEPDGGDGEPGLGREGHHHLWRDWIPGRWINQLVRQGAKFQAQTAEKQQQQQQDKDKCTNCTVHTGFWTSWQNTRPLILPYIKQLHAQYPTYKLELVGHSLGGAVASLAGLELDAMGLNPTVTTFGEPKVGNEGLRKYIDRTFELPSENSAEEEKREPMSGRYRRVTHVDDPVPLLPLQEWGYRAHAGEHYISKPDLQPGIDDIHLCYGDEDVDCIYGAEVDASFSWFTKGQDSTSLAVETYNNAEDDVDFEKQLNWRKEGKDADALEKRWGVPIPARHKMWQLFFAHRDYFWRLGLCVPGGDPLDWGRDKYRYGDEDDERGAGREQGEL